MKEDVCKICLGNDYYIDEDNHVNQCPECVIQGYVKTNRRIYPMKPELKPFIPLIAKLYINYGYKHYPLCRFKQEEIDVKVISEYVANSILHLHSDK